MRQEYTLLKNRFTIFMPFPLLSLECGDSPVWIVFATQGPGRKKKVS